VDPSLLEGDEPSLVNVAPALPRPFRPLAAAAALVAAALTFGLGFALARSKAPQPPAWGLRPIVIPIHAPAGVTLADAAPAVSPDGSRVAFLATSKGTTGLWIRALDQPEATPLAGTAGATLPFWSPDGRSLGFSAEGRLRRIDLATGTAQAFAPVPRVWAGGDWSRDGVIVFSTRAEIMRMAAAGGEPAPLARLDLSHFEDSLRFPQFLPDGRRYLYVARSGRPEQSAAYVGSLADGTTRRLFPVQSKVSYDSGHLVFARDGTLMAQPFDPATLSTRGEAVPIVPSVEQRANSLMAFFSTSTNGVLAYRKESASRNELRWLDRTGRVLGSLGGPESKWVANHRISPSGDRVAFDEFDNRTGVRAVWIADLRAGTRTRLTFSGSDWDPIWSPDGSEIAFRSHRDGQPNVYRRNADGTGVDERMLGPGEERSPRDWSPDGRFLAYQEANRLYARPLAGAGQPITIGADGNGVALRFSPSGRHVVYASDESGQLEVYVEPFPPTGAKWQVSSATLWAVAVEPGATFRAGAARALFKVDAAAMNGGANKYDVTRDGQRFLVNGAYDPPASDPILVVLNWTALLPH
jgi:Tol biopolymer transport system component